MFETIKQSARDCRKYGDQVLVYWDMAASKVFYKSFSGLVFEHMVEDAASDEGYKTLMYAIKYNGNGVKLVKEQLV